MSGHGVLNRLARFWVVLLRMLWHPVMQLCISAQICKEECVLTSHHVDRQGAVQCVTIISQIFGGVWQSLGSSKFPRDLGQSTMSSILTRLALNYVHQNYTLCILTGFCSDCNNVDMFSVTTKDN